MKALIDTCVAVDALQSREPFAGNAQKIFLLAANRRFVGCITAKSLTDIYYLTRHVTHDEKKTREILGKLSDIFEIVDTAGIDCKRAVLSEVADYEDAVMVETAVRIGADCIVTRNERDFKKSSASVYSPEEFIRRVEKETD